LNSVSVAAETHISTVLPDYLEAFTKGVEDSGCTKIRQISSIEYAQIVQIYKLGKL